MTAIVGSAALACCLLALGTTAARLVEGLRGATARITGTLVWSAVLVVCYTFALSAAHALTWPAMLALAVAGAVLATRVARSERGERRTAPVEEPVRTAPADGLIAAAVAALLAALGSICVFTILSAPEVGGDNLGYHLPRLGYWLQFHAVVPFLANNPRIGTFPANGNILHLLPVLFLRSDRLCGFVQLISCYATGLAIYGMARRLSAPRSSAALAALLWFAIPSVLLQCTVSAVDLVTAFFVTAALYFLVLELTEPSVAAAATSAAAAAFAVGAKPQTLPFAILVWALLAARHREEKRRPSLRTTAALGVAILLLTAPFPIENYRRFGHFAGSAQLQTLLLDPGLASLAKNAQLVLAPLLFWRWSDGGAAPYRGWIDATLSEGLGLLWTGAAAVAVPYALWRGIRTRSRGNTRLLAALGCALLALVATLFMARHQPSVVRFALPAVAPLSVAFAVLHADLAAGARPRVASSLSVAVALAAAFVCLRDAREVLASRVQAGRLAPWSALPAPSDGPSFSPVEARYGVDSAPIAAAVRRLPDGSRIGLLTRHFAYEGLAFGDRYAMVPIPLSYDPPQSVEALDRLGLDAVWVSDLLVQLFRIDAAGAPDDPRNDGQRTWSVTDFHDYDDAFVHVHDRATFWLDLTPLTLALLDPSSGWGLAASANEGMLFVKGRAAVSEARVINVFNQNGLETFQGRPFFWIGGRATAVRIYAPRAQRVALVGELTLGSSIAGAADRRLRVWIEGRPTPLDLTLGAGLHEIPLDLDSGFNDVRLTALDSPDAVAPSGDRRPMLLGVKGLALRPLAPPVEASPP